MNFYDASAINEIRISFRESDWRHILDSLFINQGDSGRLIGDVKVNGEEFPDAGIRYKGYSSWNSNEIKNPFNIDLDYIHAGQDYQGFAKIKLSNVIHDPSFVREVLSYEIARQYMPAPRANYSRLFVNEEYIGLYTNVEAIDKRFITSRFGSNDRSFFKGEPETLIYPFGQNANLAYSHGTDTSGYLPYYKMESDRGWSNLVNLIRILNTNSDSLGQYLNIDRALWMHAFNYALLNLDSYIGYAQNYYLYEDENGRFNPLLWDLNMSFGSFRDTDGSTNFLGLTIPKLKTLDPLQHLKFSISPRPLMTRLFANDTLKRMYLAHIRTIIGENIENGNYYSKALSMQELIRLSVQADTNKFYSFQDFINNADTTVGGVGSMILYPGLRDLMTARSAYLAGYKGISSHPLITEIRNSPEIPLKQQPVVIEAKIEDASEVILAYRCKREDLFTQVSMWDNGQSGDAVADDGFFTASVLLNGNVFQYYIYAQNDSAGVFSPPRAAYEYYTLQPAIGKGELVINEVSLNNNEWIEIQNRTTEPINLEGFRFTFSSELMDEWLFPDVVIEAGKFLCVDSRDITGNYLDFSIPGKNFIKLELENSKEEVIDSHILTTVPDSRTLGRYPNGYGPFVFMEPSPCANNFVGTTPTNGFNVYPNPASEQFTIEFVNPREAYNIEIFNASGQCIFKEEYDANPEHMDAVALQYECKGFSGLLIVRISGNGFQEIEKLLVR
ncbi:MAG: CotH kinase family protein [Bacteroidales bacterium]|nr:CotH kinase family protein [Bacteroidales bacterium]